MIRRRRARQALAIVAGVAVSLLAGCAQIPHSGPVVAGGVGDPDPREGVFQVIPEGPQTGAAPTELVRGFIRASAGFGDDLRVARSFLADQRKLTWRPDAQIEVFPSEKDLSITAKTFRDTGEVTVTAPISIEVNGDGRYSIAKPGATVSRKFTLSKVDGQWRISGLDDGTMITKVDFDSTFQPFLVYFPDPGGSYLIPDVHWFAGARDQPGSPEIPTALVRVLLQGPPKWLQGAVTTGVPAGTSMALGAVVVSDEVADVDLSSQALKADSLQRRMLAGQLRATLDQLSTVGSVKITVRQVEFDTSGDEKGPAATAEPNSQPWLQTDPQVGDQALVVDGKGRLAWLSGRSLETMDDVEGLRGVILPAVSFDRTTYAGLSADRGQLMMQTQGSDKAVQVTKGDRLAAPSFDPQGWVWTGPRDNSGSLYAARTGKSVARVSAKWLDGDHLVSLRISRDGARALIGAEVGGRGRVYVSGVVRDSEGTPTQLTEPIGLIPDLTGVTDTAWVDEDQVAVLGTRSGDSDQQVWLAQIGGPVTGKGGVAGAQTVTAGDGESSLSIGTATGTYTYLQGWQRASDARWPAYPG
jgi:hypothetical protein